MVEEPGSWTDPGNFASTPQGENILENAYGAANRGEDLIDDITQKLKQSLTENDQIKEELHQVGFLENQAKEAFEHALSNLEQAHADVPSKVKTEDLSKEQAQKKHFKSAERQFNNALENTDEAKGRLNNIEAELKRLVEEIHEERKEEAGLEELEEEIELNLKKLEEAEF